YRQAVCCCIGNVKKSGIITRIRRMKKLHLAAGLAALLSVNAAQAAPISYTDLIEDFSLFGTGFELGVGVALEGVPLQYHHDINPYLNLAAGDRVLDASLTLDFTNDLT